MVFCTYESPVGRLTLCAQDNAITSLRIDAPAPTGAVFSSTDPTLLLAAAWLDAYFSGQQPGVRGLPLSPGGTAFQSIVWQYLLEIPYGATTTYGALAKKVAAAMGVPTMSSQAIGGAVGKNPIAIMIPCHRVLGAGGKMTGFAYGIGRKEALLQIEGAI